MSAQGMREHALVRSTAASCGCGCAHGQLDAFADLRPGDTVLDLGSNSGADVLVSALRVGRRGRAIGIEANDEMRELARANAAKAGLENAEFVKGEIDEIPLPKAS